MTAPLKLLCVLAHPDDESLGVSGILTKYAVESIETYLITATWGQAGWAGPEAEFPGAQRLGEMREQELFAAAKKLSLHEVSVLDYDGGELAASDAGKVVGDLVSHIRRIRPDVVVTLDPFGAYGHPDHIAISQLTVTAIFQAASPDRPEVGGRAPHQAKKLYYRTITRAELAAYELAYGQMYMTVDGIERRTDGWQPWAVATAIDTLEQWGTIF